tara:strand:+ start:698 stop:2491 length:1794 start_codon:yes stop_codon:yes gene_type:complete
VPIFKLLDVRKIDKTFEIFDFLNKKRKFQFFLISIIAVFAALFESLSIGLLIPIVSILISNETNNSQYIWFLETIDKYNHTNINSSYLLFTLFILVIIFGGFIKILYLYLQSIYGSLVVQEFNKSILRNSILKPYENFISSESSIYISAILNKSTFVSRYLRNLLLSLVAILSFLGISGALFLINLKLSLFVFLFVFIFYWVVSDLIKKRVKVISRVTSELATKELQILNEIDGLQKEILFNDNFQFFLQKFHKIDQKYRDKEAEASYLSSSPRYILEALVLTFASITILFATKNNNFKIDFLPLLAAFLLGIQKLLPIVQSLYASWINHKTVTNGIIEIIRLSKEFRELSFLYLKETKDINKFSNFKMIKLIGVNFCYKKTNNYIFDDINLNINHGEFIGIVGESGEGKSTILNIICGLLKPTKGSLYVDQDDIFSNFENLKSWRSQISYVSQNIYLTPGSILSNITMVDSEHPVDQKRLKYSIEASQLDIYVKSLKKGIFTNVGERGIEISGGQKQRIALARALYKKNSLLILDEATSALDKKNEMNVIYSLKKLLNKDQTIIAVSHKLEILKDCDKIFKLSGGKFKEEKYDKLI